MSSKKLPFLTLQQLAEEFFGVSATALYCRHHRNPHSIPPPIRIPSTKSLLFSRETVIEWFLTHQEQRETHHSAPHRKPASIRKKGASTKSERIESRKLGISVKELRLREVTEK
jgi:hypothetical protein